MCTTEYKSVHRLLPYTQDYPGDAVVKNPLANAGDAWDVDSIPGLGRSPGMGNSNLLQYSCLKNSMDRGAWQATALGISKSRTWLSVRASTHTHTHTHTQTVDRLHPFCPPPESPFPLVTTILFSLSVSLFHFILFVGFYFVLIFYDFKCCWITKF